MKEIPEHAVTKKKKKSTFSSMGGWDHFYHFDIEPGCCQISPSCGEREDIIRDVSSGSEPRSHLCEIRHEEELDGTLYAVEMMHVKTLIPRPACFSKFPFGLSFEAEMFIAFIDLVNKTPWSETRQITHFISHAPEVSFMPLVLFISKVLNKQWKYTKLSKLSQHNLFS